VSRICNRKSRLYRPFLGSVWHGSASPVKPFFCVSAP
jgi:hypothetical protein